MRVWLLSGRAIQKLDSSVSVLPFLHTASPTHEALTGVTAASKRGRRTDSGSSTRVYSRATAGTT